MWLSVFFSGADQSGSCEMMTFCQILYSLQPETQQINISHPECDIRGK